MIELPWKVRPSIDERMLKVHLNRIASRSGTSKDFVIQIPIPILEYIKDEGINAEIITLSDHSPLGQVWIRVIKHTSKKEPS